MAFSIDLALQLAAVIVMCVVSLKMKALDRNGMVVAMIIGFIIVTSVGWRWLAVIVAFFIVSALFTKFRYEYKQGIGSAQDKMGERGWRNCLANGLIPAIAAIAELYTHNTMFATFFIGAVATCTADTLATEVGLLSKIEPRCITTFRLKVQAGTSGGITPLGIFMSLIGSALISFLAALLQIGIDPSRILFIGIGSGFIGSIVDSLLGATLQGSYRCAICQTTTEKSVHHGLPATKTKGLRWMDNNVVNLMSALVGALMALGLQLFM